MYARVSTSHGHQYAKTQLREARSDGGRRADLRRYPRSIAGYSDSGLTANARGAGGRRLTPAAGGALVQRLPVLPGVRTGAVPPAARACSRHQRLRPRALLACADPRNARAWQSRCRRFSGRTSGSSANTSCRRGPRRQERLRAACLRAHSRPRPGSGPAGPRGQGSSRLIALTAIALSVWLRSARTSCVTRRPLASTWTLLVVMRDPGTPGCPHPKPEQFRLLVDYFRKDTPDARAAQRHHGREADGGSPSTARSHRSTSG